MYAKLNNGVIMYAPLNYVNEEGQLILNFNKSIEAMTANGFKEVIDVVPDYNPTTQYVSQNGFTESDDSITVNYVVGKKDIPYEEQLQMQTAKAMEFFAENLTDEQAAQVPLIFESWAVDTAYEIGKRVLYNGTLYKVITAHTSQETWTPADAPSLFAKVINETMDGSIPDFEQPDSTNAYMKGDKVKYNGKIYVSLIDNNVWSPDGYPAGWKEVIE